MRLCAESRTQHRHRRSIDAQPRAQHPYLDVAAYGGAACGVRLCSLRVLRGSLLGSGWRPGSVAANGGIFALDPDRLGRSLLGLYIVQPHRRLRLGLAWLLSRDRLWGDPERRARRHRRGHRRRSGFGDVAAERDDVGVYLRPGDGLHRGRRVPGLRISSLRRQYADHRSDRQGSRGVQHGRDCAERRGLSLLRPRPPRRRFGSRSSRGRLRYRYGLVMERRQVGDAGRAKRPSCPALDRALAENIGSRPTRRHTESAAIAPA